MHDAIFIITLVSEIAAGICLIISAFRPQARVWPPAELLSWRALLMNILFLGSAAGLLILGLMDWRTPAADPVSTLRVILGIAGWSVGFALSSFAIFSLGARFTAGETSSLCRRGPYCFTRNPQYLGFGLMLIGWHLLIVSVGVLALAGLAGLILWLLPYAEEPFLRSQFGMEYDTYRSEVPRWLWR
jgi:protein-S-isoprenylcysteine O-methyltransferase Ste14